MGAALKRLPMLFAVLFAAAVMHVVPAAASPIAIVAIGASNTSGWGVGQPLAYPAQLEALLRAAGWNVRVRNAGIAFQTTNGMLARLDSSVPDGTRLVIIQPGGNDLRFFGTRQRRAANIDAMVTRLRARNIAAIVYDPVFEAKYFQWDAIHINADGHRMIAQSLLTQVLAIIGRRGI